NPVDERPPRSEGKTFFPSGYRATRSARIQERHLRHASRPPLHDLLGEGGHGRNHGDSRVPSKGGESGLRSYPAFRRSHTRGDVPVRRNLTHGKDPQRLSGPDWRNRG